MNSQECLKKSRGGIEIDSTIDSIEDREEGTQYSINEGFKDKVRTLYAVYQCSNSTETRGSHMRGKACEGWEMRTFRKHSINSLKQVKKGTIQMLCPCGNRPRKDVGELKIFSEKEWAETYKRAKNTAHLREEE